MFSDDWRGAHHGGRSERPRGRHDLEVDLGRASCRRAGGLDREGVPAGGDALEAKVLTAPRANRSAARRPAVERDAGQSLRGVAAGIDSRGKRRGHKRPCGGSARLGPVGFFAQK